MVETECLAPAWRNTIEQSARFLQQHEGADNIGVDEVTGGVDRAVDMGFRRKVQDRIRALTLEQSSDGLAVGDVGLHKAVARACGDARERSKVGGVGELVEIDDRPVCEAYQMPADGRANEAGAPGYE